jgi:hypothetical protein
MTTAGSFAFTFSKGGYTVTVRRTAEGVEARDSVGVTGLVRGGRDAYQVGANRYSGAGLEGESPEEVAAFGALGDMEGLHALGATELELCGAAIRHLLLAPFTRDHQMTITENGLVTHNGEEKETPTTGGQLAFWNPLVAMGPW